MYPESGYDEFLDEDLFGRNSTQQSAMTSLEEIPTYTRRIMLTGGAGFIGSVLVKKLVLNYPEYFILVIDKLDYCSSLNNLKPFLDLECGGSHSGARVSPNPSFPNFMFLQADIIDAQAVEAALIQYQINTIIHLAAQTHVDKSFGESIDFTRNNVLGTHVMLEAARKIFGLNEKTPMNGCMNGDPAPRFIFVSTDEVYGEVLFEESDSREDAPLAPSNPYSATKAAAECMVQAYHKSFRLPVIITRSNNVYGPSQYPEKIFPKFIMNLLKEDPTLEYGPLESGKCYIHGSGHHWRTYLYVTDAANALDIILHRGVVGQVYNIGAGEELNNIELAQLLIHRMVNVKEEGQLERGSHSSRKSASNASHAHLQSCDACASRIEFVEDRVFNDLRYAVDSTKLQSLGWEPKVVFNEGIDKTIQWYRQNGSTWWGDIHGALYPHSIRQPPEPTTSRSPSLAHPTYPRINPAGPP
ncbi:hypothetical protein BGZ81_011269 [Podila clonocystis]|nr:hypothetical protein BGZ81_011269 [Podila clonocystis]